MMPVVTVIGGGLAGVEAAVQLARRKIPVVFYEQKPQRFSPAHQSSLLGELVCSNSLKSKREYTAPAMLKWEMEQLGSLVLEAAEATRVPAGGALAVNREEFSLFITQAIEKNPHITVVREEVRSLPQKGRTIVATGPLTSGALYKEIQALVGEESLYFYDAAAPIVTGDSVDADQAFCQGRYDQEADYLNCPLTEEEYNAFYDALVSAEGALLTGADQGVYFEGCMPVEALAKRGRKTLLFGPMSPKGLDDPRSGRWPYAVVQLRKEDKEGRLYNLVGFQTNLKFQEQKRVFSMIPALSHAEFVRYGVMHRNTYLHSPHLLDERLRLKSQPNLSFAGQMTGVEGYVESAASGILAGLYGSLELLEKEIPILENTTMIGALAHYVVQYEGKDFQPMNANFGILPALSEPIKQKKERYMAMVQRGREAMERFLRSLGGSPEGFGR